MIQLGDTVKDKVSGFTGIVTARIERLYSGPEVTVAPQKLAGEVPAETKTFFENQVERIDAEVKQKAGLV